jgi:hypothetical protein
MKGKRVMTDVLNDNETYTNKRVQDDLSRMIKKMAERLKKGYTNSSAYQNIDDSWFIRDMIAQLLHRYEADIITEIRHILIDPVDKTVENSRDNLKAMRILNDFDTFGFLLSLGVLNRKDASVEEYKALLNEIISIIYERLDSAKTWLNWME